MAEKLLKWFRWQVFEKTTNENVLPQTELDAVRAALKSSANQGDDQLDLDIVNSDFGAGLMGAAVEPTAEGGSFVGIPVTGIALLRVIALLLMETTDGAVDGERLSLEECRTIMDSLSTQCVKGVVTKEEHFDGIEQRHFDMVMGVARSVGEKHDAIGTWTPTNDELKPIVQSAKGGPWGPEGAPDRLFYASMSQENSFKLLEAIVRRIPKTERRMPEGREEVRQMPAYAALFVMHHELAHVRCGHLEAQEKLQDPQFRHQYGIDDTFWDKLVYGIEVDADCWALRVLLESLVYPIFEAGRPMEAIQVFRNICWGVTMTLALIYLEEMIDNFREKYHRGAGSEKVDGTRRKYPPAPLRLAILYSWLQRTFTPATALEEERIRFLRHLLHAARAIEWDGLLALGAVVLAEENVDDESLHLAQKLRLLAREFCEALANLPLAKVSQ